LLKTQLILPKRDGRMVGIVSRSDVIRQLCVERADAETMCVAPPEDASSDRNAEQQAISRQVASRMQNLHARDIMSTDVISVAPDTSAEEMARMMVERGIHEFVVTANGQVTGVIESLDLLGLLAKYGLASTWFETFGRREAVAPHDRGESPFSPTRQSAPRSAVVRDLRSGG
jgi:CBS domain-containing protein